MFSVIGWLVIAWLLGSVVYSSLFHIRTYRVQKKRILTEEVGEVYARLHKEMKWGTLFTIQIIKVIVALMLIYFLTSGKEIKTINHNGWTEKNKMAFFEGCMGNVPILEMTQKQMQNGNTLIVDDGGGAFVDCAATLTDNTFTGNTAHYYGGAYY